MGVLGINNLIDWESESYPVATDFIAIPLFAVFFLSVRFVLDKYVFEVSSYYSLTFLLLVMVDYVFSCM
jgi:ceramide synthetase